MRYVLSVFALLLCVVMILGAARPFDRVAADDHSYDHLNTIADAGLLDGFSIPDGELSRLEFAVLVQKSLAQYGEVQLAGYGTQAAVEVALGELLAEFTDELNQLGSTAAMPAHDAMGVGELEQRVSYLEDEVDEFYFVENETYEYAECYCGECEEEEEEGDAIEVSVYGDFYLQFLSENTSYVTTGVDDITSTDLNLYYGELGFEADDGQWFAHFSVNIDEEEVTPFQYYGQYTWPSGETYAVIGHLEVPFSNNDFYFPTYPAVNDFGLQELDVIGLGIDRGTWGMNAWLFNPTIEVGDEENNFTDYSLVWDITMQEADECQDGWRVTAGYTSHLAEHALCLCDSVVDRVAAYNVFGRYDWCGGQYHLLADYTAAIDEYVATDLDANADGIGDQPTALNVEFVYEPLPDTLWGVAYQTTDELMDYAETRYGVLYGKRLSPLAMLKLEYTHGEYGSFVSNGQDTDDRFVAELNLAF